MFDLILLSFNTYFFSFFTFHRTVPKDDLSPSMYFLRFSESFHSSWAYVEDNANAPNNNNNNTIDGQNGTTISNKDYYQYTLVTISQSGYEKHRIKWDLDSRTFIRLDPHGNRTVASTLLESFPPNILFYDRSAYPDEVKLAEAIRREFALNIQTYISELLANEQNDYYRDLMNDESFGNFLRKYPKWNTYPNINQSIYNGFEHHARLFIYSSPDITSTLDAEMNGDDDK
jgi:hypothetical protein